MIAADKAAPVAAASRSLGVDGLPPSNNTAAARLAASPRHAEWVRTVAFFKKNLGVN